MGPEVIPLILAELVKEPDHLFWALAAIIVSVLCFLRTQQDAQMV